MKNIVGRCRLIILALFLFLIAACSSAAAAAPSDTVVAFLEAPPPLAEIEEEFRGAFENFSYEITSETINDDTAYVSLVINTLDFAAVMEEVMAEAFYWVFEDMTVTEFSIRVESLFLEKMTDDDVPIAEKNITVPLKLIDNQWEIITDNALADAVTGGLVSFAEYAGQWLD